ncbi:transmembrane and coiled-coil domains protein 1 isoform X2 [Patella vulgata]|uniref:transmembrane and coiled-coil domains protein 1 isoform X2 n=1 Tax=Patella vulgata TaxID=6465 RepID=UPI00217FA720|nr:transmembrane and coiled-coil domains protein 1 isoform X2 [Patella vulgata]
MVKMKVKNSLDGLDAWYDEKVRRNSTPDCLLRNRSTNSRLSSPGQGHGEEGSAGTTGYSHSAVDLSDPRTPTPSTSTDQPLFLQVPDPYYYNHVVQRRRQSFDVSADSIRSARGVLAVKVNTPTMKKSDSSKIPSLKPFRNKAAKSPNLPKKPTSSLDNVKIRTGSGTLHPPDDGPQSAYSTEDLDTVCSHCSDSKVDGMTRENGTSLEAAIDDVDDCHTTDADKTKAAIGYIQSKINKTKDMIKQEQSVKESNVNEYLRLATSADKQQAQRIKTVFEKRNQKSAQSIIQMQKKLENLQKKQDDIEQHGVTSHKQAKEMLRDVGQGLKGVVDSVKGAKESIVAKPKEFAHLIKNKFGSEGNINQIKMEDNGENKDQNKSGGTLPASFKYEDNEDDNSSITSGSGFGAQSSPHSTSQNITQTSPLAQTLIEPILHDISDVREEGKKIQDTIQRIIEDFEAYRNSAQADISMLRHLLDEEKYKIERMEDQMNDLTELHQNEITNLKQDITSMEEKIEYRLEERTSDLSDLVDNCQTRIQRMEQQQQQQQILSMEMVENVTFRTILTKLINVVLALVAVILVFVSTAANLLSPFLTTRLRIISTIVIIFALTLIGQNYDSIGVLPGYIWDKLKNILPW